jgi:ketosteroid isomerase-like protein
VTLLEERLDRVESELAIRQLPSRYALAVDSRDLDTWVSLSVEDVDCGRHAKGRDALKAFIAPHVRTFYRSIHLVGVHVIDFVDADHATGTVYCRAEHEDGDKWIVMAILYFDTYERRDRSWYFVRRSERHWYSADVLERPSAPDFQHWPKWQDAKPQLPEKFATWLPFWADATRDQIDGVTNRPIG